MSFNAKDMTQGGQIASMRIRMFSQIANIMLYCLFIALPPRTHRLLLVELEEEKWIADVGFGGQTLTAPIRLVSDLVQTTPHGEYRLLSNRDALLRWMWPIIGFPPVNN